MTRSVEGERGLSPALIGLVALCAGVTVSNLYLTQPLLTLIVEGFVADPSRVGLLPVLGQVGYALGILLIVPLGDVLRRRGLLVVVLTCLVVSLAAAAFVPSLTPLMALTLLVSALTVVPQILIPFASQLAGDEHRGRVLAIIGAMLTCGLFASRSLYGQIGDAFGWRASYVVAAILSAVVGAITIAVLPKEEKRDQENYAALLASLPKLIVEEPVLRRACLLQGAVFATFNIFWTTIVFLLTSAPYEFSAGTAGLFGLFGLISAATAPVIGRSIDRRGPVFTLGVCLVITLVSAKLFDTGQTYLAAVIAAIILLGIGVQGAMSANQTRILSVRPEAASRMNTVFLVVIFACGAAGGALGSTLYHVGGWTAVSVAGMAVSAVGFVGWLIFDYSDSREQV